MNKIPTLFIRDPETNRRYVKNEVTPGCEWVLAGEGIATRKYDGTAVRIAIDSSQDTATLWRRHEVKPGRQMPEGFEVVEFDETTGKTVGWVRCDRTNPSDRWHFEGFDYWLNREEPPGTYELLGPKVQGNPEHMTHHDLIRHGYMSQADQVVFSNSPRDFIGLGVWLRGHPYEGIVWHHSDGRMAKLKKRDFPASD